MSDKPLFLMKKKPIQARSMMTVDAILCAATRILLDLGYDASSTNKIAKLAGVSIGSLYEYFPGKEAIFAELRRREDQRLYDLTMSKSEPDSVKELVEHHIFVYLEFVKSNLELHKALINDVPQFAIDQYDLPFYRDYLPWAIKFLNIHVKELRFNNDIERVTEFILRVSRSTIDNYVLNAPEQLIDSLIESLLIDLNSRFLLR